MTKVLNISNKPTYDLENIEIVIFIEDDSTLFFKSKEVFHFDKVYWTVTPRSRVIRYWKNESELVENITTAVIDAWYFGHLHWKIKLTKAWVKLSNEIKDLTKLAEYFKDCQQIHMFQSIAWNYYEWTSNRPDLLPDIIFTL